VHHVRLEILTLKLVISVAIIPSGWLPKDLREGSPLKEHEYWIGEIKDMRQMQTTSSSEVSFIPLLLLTK
jgi:hypothetical protein